MQAIYRSAGESIDHTPASNVSAGDVIVRGDLVCVAKLDIQAGELGAVAIRGVFEAVKDDSDLADGAKVYWDADGNPVGGTAGSGAFSGSDGAGQNKFAGYAIGAAGPTAGTFQLLLGGR